MIYKEKLKEVLVSNAEDISRIESIAPRENFELPSPLHKVVDIYGVRRSGKTYCLYDIFRKRKDQSFYLDFEDDRLEGFELKDFSVLTDAIYELSPSLKKEETCLLLDEVQNVAGWEKFARRAAEKEKINVFVTGSSSKMTSRQLHTVLRGRSWGIEIFPFSFREYLTLKKIDYKNPRTAFGGERQKIKGHFLDYLKWGGFPEVSVLDSETKKTKAIKEYLEAIFFKDLVERFKVANIPLLEVLREKLFSSFAQKLSLGAFYKQIKDQMPASKDSLFAYYKYFLESMIVFEARKFSPSAHKRIRNPAKIYLVDTALSKKVTSEDKGRQLENIVFLELKRRGLELFYFEGEGECDFIAKDASGKIFPVQTTWEITPSNQERELAGLTEACKQLNVSEGLILTFDEEKEESMEGITIRFISVWKWIINA